MILYDVLSRARGLWLSGGTIPRWNAMWVIEDIRCSRKTHAFGSLTSIKEKPNSQGRRQKDHAVKIIVQKNFSSFKSRQPEQ